MAENHANPRDHPVKTALYGHQREAVNFSLEQLEAGGGSALLMEMGTGKTLTSIAITGALWNAGRIQRLLIVAPLSILGVWQDEFAKFAVFDYALTMLEGTTARKVDTIRHMTGTALQVLVVNYESAWRLEADLAKWRPDMIVADEGHKVKTHNIAASKALHRLSTKAKYRLLLTGTIITNKPVDVFSQYKFADPRVYGNSFYLFRNRYFDMVGYGNHTPVMKRSMEAEFTERLHSIAFRATKAECLDLPDTTDIVQRVELEPAAMRTYRQLVKDSYAELAGDTVTVTNVLTRLLRLSQLTGGFLGGDDSSATEQVSSAKLDALSDITESAEQDGKKLVIIARFIPEIRAIGKLLTKKGIRYSQISGEIKGRDAQVAAFQNDPGVTVFVGQIATAGLGITLTAASTMVFFSMDYSMSNYEQTRARIHRVGQRQPCTYIHLVAKDTVDEKVLQALRDKANLAKALVDDYRAGRNPFMPDRTGIGFITLSGFNVRKAATTWAPPAAYQDGMVGPHWSRGWIIEDCEISNSKCCGISLGKYLDPENDMYFYTKHVKSPTQMERDAVCRGQYHGWLKEKVGGHIVRRCNIHHCEQTGIVGRMGGVFSIIEDCHIHHICNSQQLGGAETAGIKLHAAIDVTIRRNHFHHCIIGVWCDWQAQGSRISGNLMHDNHRPEGVQPAKGAMFSCDVFIEVSHGPTLIDNNILLSKSSVSMPSEGIACVHNLMLGSFTLINAGVDSIVNGQREPRYTPYHIRHRTEVAGFMTILHGDDRIYNNIFIQHYPVTDKSKTAQNNDYEVVGTASLDIFPTYDEWISHFMMGQEPDMRALATYHFGHLPVWVKGNAYFGGASVSKHEEHGLIRADVKAKAELTEKDGKYYLNTNVYSLLEGFRNELINTETLGLAFEPEQRFENPDETPIVFDEDYFGERRGDTILPGPFAGLTEEDVKVAEFRMA